jgi:hypothetical protein
LVAALAMTIAQSGTESPPAEQAVWRAFAPPHAATLNINNLNKKSKSESDSFIIQEASLALRV